MNESSLAIALKNAKEHLIEMKSLIVVYIENSPQ